MDFCLIAAGDFSWLSLQWWGYMLQVAFGLGVVIFVHELGHFLVAKACGVKCEKFYLGFDVPMPKIGPLQIPSKLLHFQYGETEYGIGIIPLGGYVKMLGQDDNPANAEKESERTRVTRTADHHHSITDVDLEPQPLAEQMPFEVDPRSYTAKNVPQRMAIISAGVIMNVIFAVIFATIAYRIGVPYTPAYIGGTQPGSPAWKADLPVGARIAQVGRKGEPRPHLRYRQDFQQGVLLHGYKTDLPLLIEPRGGGQPQWVEIRPEAKDVGMLFGQMALIGVEPMADVRINSQQQVVEGFPAALAKTKLLAGDRIVSAKAAGETAKIEIYPDLHAFLARHVDDEVTLTVERTTKSGVEERKELLEVVLIPRPVQTLGIAMTMGPITALQKDSPAIAAGLKVGDVLEAIDGAKIADPMLVADDLRRRAGEEVTLTVLRGDRRTPVIIKVTPRIVRDAQTSVSPDEPVLVDALGVTIHVEAKVASVSADSPAHGKLEPGDVLTSVQLIPSGESAQAKAASREMFKKLGLPTEELSLAKGTHADGKQDWPAVFSMLQRIVAGTEVKLTFTRNGVTDSMTLSPYADANYNFMVRGLSLEQLTLPHHAKTWSEAFYLGRRETWESLGLVVTFLKKLVTGQIRLTALGGPGTIAVAATSEASRGPAALLIFLTMLSANLAVVNFLPIPVLDGGHMMFLAYEGIFRRPVNEKWQIRLSLLGLSFVLCLMVFVIGLDFYRLSGLAQ